MNTTLKQGKESKTYYDILPYLYHLSSDNKEKMKDDKSGIYVDDSHLTHGILFPGVNVYKEQSNTLSIFKMPLDEYLDPNNGKSLEEKNRLDAVFKGIMQELDLDKDKESPIKFEAGKLNMMSLSPIQHRRLAGIVVKHESEWKSTRAADFAKVCALYRANQKIELAECIDKQMKDLSISVKVGQFDTDREAYYVHPLGFISLFTRKLQLITQEMLNAVAPGQGGNVKLLMALNKYVEQYEINTPLRIAHFLAQCAHESGGFTDAEEKIYYRKVAALDYKKFRDSPLHIQNAICPPNAKYCKQSELFNLTYGGRLGNNTTGDGFFI